MSRASVSLSSDASVLGGDGGPERREERVSGERDIDAIDKISGEDGEGKGGNNAAAGTEGGAGRRSRKERDAPSRSR